MKRHRSVLKLRLCRPDLQHPKGEVPRMLVQVSHCHFCFRNTVHGGPLPSTWRVASLTFRRPGLSLSFQHMAACAERRLAVNLLPETAQRRTSRRLQVKIFLVEFRSAAGTCCRSKGVSCQAKRSP